MKAFSALLFVAFCIGAVFSSALPEESAAPAESAPAESATAAPATSPAPTESAPAAPAAPAPAKPGKPGKGPRDPTIEAAKELERKLEKALRLSRGKLQALEKALGEPRKAIVEKLEKIRGELIAKAKIAKKEGKKGLSRALIANAINLSQLNKRIARLR
uniref:Uncharacterized protein n=1 Tax=Lygus hesperus TaxID=30085 RepID=A0A146LHZ7_LYGHE